MYNKNLVMNDNHGWQIVHIHDIIIIFFFGGESPLTHLSREKKQPPWHLTSSRIINNFPNSSTASTLLLLQPLILCPSYIYGQPLCKSGLELCTISLQMRLCMIKLQSQFLKYIYTKIPEYQNLTCFGIYGWLTQCL